VRIATFVQKAVRNEIFERNRRATGKNTAANNDKVDEGWVFWMYYMQIVADVVETIAEYGFFPVARIDPKLKHRFEHFSTLYKHCVELPLGSKDINPRVARAMYDTVTGMIILPGRGGTSKPKPVSVKYLSGGMLGKEATVKRDSGTCPNPSFHDIALTTYTAKVVKEMGCTTSDSDPCKKHGIEYIGNTSGSCNGNRDGFKSLSDSSSSRTGKRRLQDFAFKEDGNNIRRYKSVVTLMVNGQRRQTRQIRSEDALTAKWTEDLQSLKNKAERGGFSLDVPHDKKWIEL
jgi:hypothetical protein